MSVYDIFHPIFYVSLLCGMTPFNIKGKVYKNSTLLVLCNITFAMTCTVFGILELRNREFTNRLALISDVTDYLLAWTSILNDAAIIVLNCVQRSKVCLQFTLVLMFHNKLISTDFKFVETDSKLRFGL